MAESEDKTIVMGISTGDWPDWAVNRWPQYIDRQSPIHLQSPISLSYPPENLGLTSDQRRSTSLKFAKDVLLRYKDSPALGGWELYCADYHYESYFFKNYQGHLGHTPIGLEGFRRWLKEVRGYGLKDLGKRWHGDEGCFKSWDEVMLPDPDEFFGEFNSECLAVDANWFWKKGDAGDSEKPADDAPGWTPVKMPPSAEMLALPSGPAFWRVAFDAGDWMRKNSGKDIYLVCHVDNDGWAPATDVWLNDNNLGSHASKEHPFFGPFGLKLTGLLKNGLNRLCLRVNGGSGRLVGPVFLTTTKPVWYPYLGKLKNARYVDCLEWRLHALDSLEIGAMEYARSLDPDRPFVVCATSGTVKDGQGGALIRYGGSMQDTGYVSSYRPFNSRIGYDG
jgi:hypothetical protein